MRKILLVALMAVAVVSCKKEKDPEPTNASTTTTNNAAGNWIITNYDGLALTAPAAGSLTMTGSSATEGTAKIDVTFDGVSHGIEEDTYVLSNNNANITFTKTAGNGATLSGGGTWTINTLNATTLKMTSANGLIIECTK